MVKNLPANAGGAGDPGFIPESGGSPEGGHSNLLHYSCPENPRDRGARRAAVHRVTKSWTQLKRLSAEAASIHSETILKVYLLNVF